MGGSAAIPNYMNLLLNMQRKLLLTVATVNKTVSREAVQVITRSTNIDLPISETVKL